jgi:hypothetical protein
MSHISHNHFHTSHVLDFSHATDFAFGPSRHARFGSGAPVGCNCSKENFQIAYDEEFKEVKLQNLNLSDREVRVQTALNFRPRYKADMASVQHEMSGTPKYDGLDFEVTPSGDFFYPKYGRTDTQLDERTKLLTPDQHLSSDTLTNKAIHEAVARGATHIITSYYRPEQDHRDFVEFIIDPVTRKGQLRMVNAGALTGTTHNFQEISGVATKIFGDLNLYAPSNRVFIATNKEIKSFKLEKATNQKEETRGTEFPKGLSVVEEGMEVIQRATVDSIATTQTLLDYLKMKTEPREKPTANALTLQILLTDQNYKEELEALKTQQPKKENKNSQIEWKNKAQEVLHISDEQSEALLNEINEVWAAMRDAGATIMVASDTEIGIGGALYTLNLMSLNTEDQQISEHQVDEELAFPAEILSLSEQEQEVIFSLFVPASEVSPEVVQTSDKILMNIEADYATFAKTVEFIQKIDVLPVSEQMQVIVEEKKQTTIQILFLWEMVGEAARSEAKSKTQSINSDRPILSTFKEHHKENAPVEKFTFALAAWMLLKLTQHYVSLEGLEAFVDKKEGTSLLASIQKEKPKALVQKETGQWILLSIIWYLAQIREQGLVQQKAAPKKKKKKHAPIIIFAYGS